LTARPPSRPENRRGGAGRFQKGPPCLLIIPLPFPIPHAGCRSPVAPVAVEATAAGRVCRHGPGLMPPPRPVGALGHRPPGRRPAPGQRPAAAGLARLGTRTVLLLPGGHRLGRRPPGLRGRVARPARPGAHDVMGVVAQAEGHHDLSKRFPDEGRLQTFPPCLETASSWCLKRFTAEENARTGPGPPGGPQTDQTAGTGRGWPGAAGPPAGLPPRRTAGS
jgi:hypothetical protein